MVSFGLTLALSVYLLSALAQEKSGWTCTDGWWHENGVKSSYECDSDSKKTGTNVKSSEDNVKGTECTVTSMTSTAMASFPRTCIQHSSYANGRCWWTHVPSAVASATDGRKVPLLVDMHGGGGCASHQYQSSGFKDLADVNATPAGGGMIVVWPQGGPGFLWASAGTSTRASAEATGGKALPQWSDIGFLEQLVAYMLRNSSLQAKLDPDRVYLSGFSLGCMMSHRFAMERSHIVAAFGCHGGSLSLYPTTAEQMDSDKSTYNIQPMPAYLTIGDADGWYSQANGSWYAWKYWNGCSSTTATALTSPSTFTENVASSCNSYSPTLETVMMVIAGGAHVPDARAFARQWDFMSRYKRTGVLAALSTVPSATLQPDVVDVDAKTAAGGGKTGEGKQDEGGGKGEAPSPTPTPSPAAASTSDGAQCQHAMGMFVLSAVMTSLFSSSLF